MFLLLIQIYILIAAHIQIFVKSSVNFLLSIMNSQQRVVEYLLEEASQTCNLDARNGSGVAAIEYLAKVYPEKCKELVSKY